MIAMFLTPSTFVSDMTSNLLLGYYICIDVSFSPNCRGETFHSRLAWPVLSISFLLCIPNPSFPPPRHPHFTYIHLTPLCLPSIKSPARSLFSIRLIRLRACNTITVLVDIRCIIITTTGTLFRLINPTIPLSRLQTYSVS